MRTPSLSAVVLSTFAGLLFAPTPALAQHDAARLTAQFASMTGDGWTGGDAAWSARLPDGREVWLFGDTFIGGVSAGGRRDPDAPWIRNSIVVRGRDGTLRTVTGGSESAPTSLVPGSGPDDWYWPGPPVVGSRSLEVPMAHIVRTGPGPWDFAATGTSLVEFDLRRLEPQRITAINTPPGVNMASAAVSAGRFTYIYGTRGNGTAAKEVFVARAPAGELSARWSYWTGDGWSDDPMAARAVASSVSDQFSVIRLMHRWMLISQVPYSRQIDAFISRRPTGPWRQIGQIAAIPAIPHAITYNAIVHPEYSQGRTLVIGYSVNAAEPDWVYADAALYRPRFMRVRL